MINVLAIVPNQLDSTSLYRGSGPLLSMARDFDDIDLKIVSTNEIHQSEWFKFHGYDLVIYQRPFVSTQTAEILEQIKAIKSFGIPVIADWDDLLIDVPVENPVYQNYMSKTAHDGMVKILSTVDHIFYSTEALMRYKNEFWANETKESVESINDKSTVIRNGFDERWFSHFWDKLPERKPIVTWRGTNTHIKDLMQAAPGIIDAARRSPNLVFQFFGYIPWFLIGPIEPQRVLVKNLPLVQFHQSLHSIGGQIGIVPLDSNRFNESKSNIAFIELVSSGHCVIAKNLPEFKKVGSVCYDTSDELADLITEYRLNHDLREKTWRQQFDTVKTLTLTEPNKQRYEIIRKLAKK